MKGLAVLAAVLVASVSTAAALAERPTGTKPPKGCKTAAVVLKGTVAAAPGANPTLPFGLQVTVASTNANGAAYVTATQPVTVTVTADTVITRSKAAATLSDLLAGDTIAVKARPCSSDLANGATPALTATKLTAKAARQPKSHT